MVKNPLKMLLGFWGDILIICTGNISSTSRHTLG